jgi:predicted transcriptional regulator
MQKARPSVVHIGLAVSLTRFLQLGPDRQLLGIVSREDVMRALKEATQSAQ